MLLGFLWTWYNLPFLAALVCCLLCALLQLVGGFDDGDADLDGADLDGADLNGVEGSVRGWLPDGVLSALGVGRVPLTFVLLALFGCFGLLGLLLNTLLLNTLGRYPGVALVPVLLGSLVLALLLTGRISALFARLAPDTSTAISFEQLVGRVGVVVSATVSPTYGRVLVRDNHGSTHTVFAVTSAEATIPERSEVALLAYDRPRRCFVVQPLDRLKLG